MALNGTSVIADDGETIEVTKATVGGVVSEGMLCDSKMLGWVGGAHKIAVNLPDSYDVGTSPPSSKPRQGPSNNESTGLEAAASLPGLFGKKLSKEEKKKLAAEKRARRKAAKEAKAKN